MIKNEIQCPICYNKLNRYNYRLGIAVYHNKIGAVINFEHNQSEDDGYKHPMHLKCLYNALYRSKLCPICRIRLDPLTLTELMKTKRKTFQIRSFLLGMGILFTYHLTTSYIINSSNIASIIPGIIAFPIDIKNLINEHNDVGFSSIYKTILNDLVVNLSAIIVPLTGSVIANLFTKSPILNSAFTSFFTSTAFAICSKIMIFS